MEGVPASNDYQGGFGTSLMAKVDYGLLLSVKLVEEELEDHYLVPPGIKTALVETDWLAIHHRVLLSLPQQVATGRAGQMVQKVILSQI